MGFCPSVQDPAGFVAGARDKETPDYPYGATFTGRAWSEPTLLRLAYAFEQATQLRRPPPGLPPLNPGLRAIAKNTEFCVAATKRSSEHIKNTIISVT